MSQSSLDMERVEPPAAAPVPENSGRRPASGSPPPPRGESSVAEELEQFTPWWRDHLVESATAFFGSLVVHVVLLVALALIVIKVEQPEVLHQQMVLDPVRPEDQVSELLDQRLDPTQANSLTSGVVSTGAPTIGGSGAAAAVAGPPQLDQRVMDSVGEASAELDSGIFTANPGTFGEEIPAGQFIGEPHAIVSGLDEAMDRITQEILVMMARSKVLVVWLFDESNSMKDDQREIRSRINKVYTELGLRNATTDDSLLTAVCSYGAEYRVHLRRATSDLSAIQAAIDKVPIDESGLENMCSAVVRTVNDFKQYYLQGQRRIAIILVTDESGEHADNLGFLEAAVSEAKKNQVRVYCLGREAVFGYPYAHVNWVDPTTKLNFWLRINRGPETPMIEALQTDGYHTRWDAHPSGFGPYEETRLARETGGVFFMLPSIEPNLVRGEKRVYELQAMRPYLPDLCSRQQYIQERDRHELRKSLFDIIMFLNPHEKPQLNLQLTYPIDLAQLARAAVTARATAQNLVVVYDEAERWLKRLKPLRDQEANARWQANYDLIFAQVISYKVRMYEFQAYLTEFLHRPRIITDAKTTHWHIGTRAQTLTERETGSYMQMATALFNQIIAEHPGTPYAARAQWELRRGYGIHFYEHYHDPRRNDPNIRLPKF